MLSRFKPSGALPQKIATHRVTLVERINERPSLWACIGLVLLLGVLPATAEMTCALFGAK